MFDNVAIMQETWYDKISIDRDQNPRFFHKGYSTTNFRLRQLVSW